MKYTVEAVGAIAEKLKSLPKVETTKQEVSKSEAVRLLSKEIRAMQKKGYTFKMIAEILTSNELSITESVLKSYMQRNASDGEAKGSKKEPAKAAEKKAPQVAPQVSPSVKKTNMIEDID